MEKKQNKRKQNKKQNKTKTKAKTKQNKNNKIKKTKQNKTKQKQKNIFYCNFRFMLHKHKTTLLTVPNIQFFLVRTIFNTLTKPLLISFHIHEMQQLLKMKCGYYVAIMFQNSPIC